MEAALAVTLLSGAAVVVGAPKPISMHVVGAPKPISMHGDTTLPGWSNLTVWHVHPTSNPKGSLGNMVGFSVA